MVEAGINEILESIPKPETVTVETAARILGISRMAAYQAVNEKPPQIPCIRIGRRILVPLAQLRAMLEQPRGEADDQPLNAA
jgi:excisionase family DNA binding protein